MFLDTLIAVYAVLALGQLVLQGSLAQLHWLSWLLRKRTRFAEGAGSRPLPAISVIYPIYKEDPQILDLVMRKAAACLGIPRLEVIFIDDGSPNIQELLPVYRRHECERIRVVVRDRNEGKRRVQHVGFGIARGELIITVDSDTLITTEGVRRLVRPLMDDPSLGAVTGDVQVANRRGSPLARLLALRYWIAFHLERAAQSFCGSMLCCSGPFSAYRREVIDQVKDAFVEQRFLGSVCTYGDDRHLTNLVLKEGYETGFAPDAIAETYVPETLREFIPQQTRWNKSFYREVLWTLKTFRTVGLYSLWDMLLQPTLSILFLVILASVLCAFVHTRDVRTLLYYGCMLVTMASLRALFGVLRTGRLEFLLFIFYGFVHVLVLMPVRLKALLTLSDPVWGTRGTGRKRVYRSFAVWFAIYWGLVSGIAWGLARLAPRSLELKRGAPDLLLGNWVGGLMGRLQVTSVRVMPFAAVMLALFVLLALTRSRRHRRTESCPAEGTPAAPSVRVGSGTSTG